MPKAKSCSESRKSGLIDEIDSIATGCKGDGKCRSIAFSFVLAFVSNLAVDELKIGFSSSVGTDVIENRNEYFVGLSIHLCELNGDKFHFLKNTSGKEIRCLIESAENIAFITLYNRFQLEDVAHEKHLFATESLTLIARISTKNTVDEINDVSSYH